MNCSSCGKRPATSIATGKCSDCLYEEAMGLEAAERQRDRAASARERERLAQERLKAKRR